MIITFVGEMSSAKKEKAVKKPQTKPSGAEKSGGGGAGAGGKAGRQQGKAKPSPDLNDDVKRDQKLQAILLADSFSKTFRPITLECPKVLLPLVNVPMLEYTVEFLAQNGVEEVQYGLSKSSHRSALIVLSLHLLLSRSLSSAPLMPKRWRSTSRNVVGTTR